MVARDDIIMTVYCDGVPDNAGRPTHARFPVRRYVRIWDDAADRGFWSPTTGADDPRPKPSRGWKLRFHCKKCGFDEKRRGPGIDDRKSSYEFTSRISEVFEALHATGTHQIDVRVLLRWMVAA
jgi:hypothetical protein